MWQGISINTGSMDINPNRFTWTDVNVFESNGIPRQNLLGVEIGKQGFGFPPVISVCRNRVVRGEKIQSG